MDVRYCDVCGQTEDEIGSTWDNLFQEYIAEWHYALCFEQSDGNGTCRGSVGPMSIKPLLRGVG